jgi:hypothetical protein
MIKIKYNASRDELNDLLDMLSREYKLSKAVVTNDMSSNWKKTEYPTLVFIKSIIDNLRKLGLYAEVDCDIKIEEPEKLDNLKYGQKYSYFTGNLALAASKNQSISDLATFIYCKYINNKLTLVQKRVGKEFEYIAIGKVKNND